MRTFQTFSIGIIILLSCLSWTSKHQVLIADTQKTDGDLKKIGSEILKGRKISTIDTSTIYQLIDSVLTKDSNDRRFYFEVFNRINNQAKGEIAEEINWKIKEFCNKYPNDFFNISNTEIEDYSARIGELFRTEEEYPLEAAQDYINWIKTKTNPIFNEKVKLFETVLLTRLKKEK